MCCGRPVKAISRSRTPASGSAWLLWVEAHPAAALRRDDLVRCFEYIRRDRVGRGDLLPGGLGEVPGVDQQLDGHDAQGHGRREFAVADRDRALGAAAVPGFQRDLGPVGHLGLQRVRRTRREHRAGRAADGGDRPGQVLGQLGDGEFGADRGPAGVGLADAEQHPLADGQGRPGARERVEVRRRGAPLVGPRVALGRGLGQPAEVMVPARGVVVGLLAGQSLVHHPDGRATRRRLQRDDHG